MSIEDISFAEIIESVNELAHKLAKSMGWIAPSDTKFYTPPEINGPLVEHRIPMYWAMAVVVYEHLNPICVKSVLDDYLASQ